MSGEAPDVVGLEEQAARLHLEAAGFPVRVMTTRARAAGRAVTLEGPARVVQLRREGRGVVLVSARTMVLRAHDEHF